TRQAVGERHARRLDGERDVPDAGDAHADDRRGMDHERYRKCFVKDSSARAGDDFGDHALEHGLSRGRIASISEQTRYRLAIAALFVASAGVVVWQNSRLTVLWDASYMLENASRIAGGDVPYRDFPFPYAPLTFALQALII